MIKIIVLATLLFQITFSHPSILLSENSICEKSEIELSIKNFSEIEPLTFSIPLASIKTSFILTLSDDKNSNRSIIPILKIIQLSTIHSSLSPPKLIA